VNELLDLIPLFADRRVLVVGDVVLDEYIVGTPTRLSREAPIPVLELERREAIPGGAANPTRNVAALGARAAQAAVVGEDAEGAQLLALLGAAGIDTAAVLALPGRATTVKTRVLAQEPLRFPQQVARVDRPERRPLLAAEEARLLRLVERQAPALDALICSDYRLGLLTPALTAALRELCRAHNILQTVDAQGGAELYAGVDLFRCNAAEAAVILGRPLRGEGDFRAALPELRARLGARHVIVTRGPDGLALEGEGAPYRALAAANRSEVFDTTGAGDTFIAVATLALSAGAGLEQAAELANLAAGLVVRRLGNAVVRPDELAAAVSFARDS
jgi:D-glycero-beta-D-manno-heptose-7-phosphate kinase